MKKLTTCRSNKESENKDIELSKYKLLSKVSINPQKIRFTKETLEKATTTKKLVTKKSIRNTTPKNNTDTNSNTDEIFYEILRDLIRHI